VRPLYFNDNSVEVKSDGIYVTGNPDDVLVNTISVPKKSAFQTDNNDYLWISDGQLYINTSLTDVFVNEQVYYRVLPPHISEPFRDYCKSAISIKRENKQPLSYTVAAFKHENVHFAMKIPFSSKEPYLFYFHLDKKLVDAEVERFKEQSQKNDFHKFSINSKRTRVFLQTNKFNFNDLLHLLWLVNDLVQIDKQDNSTSYIA